MELALEEGSLNMLYEEAQALVTVLQENEELLRILKHPQIDKDEKRKIVDNIFKGRVSKDMVGLFGIMVEKDHGSKIVDVLHYFIRQVKRVKNIGVASVTSAVGSLPTPSIPPSSAPSAAIPLTMGTSLDEAPDDLDPSDGDTRGFSPFRAL